MNVLASCVELWHAWQTEQIARASERNSFSIKEYGYGWSTHAAKARYEIACCGFAKSLAHSSASPVHPPPP
jgi:hypothetical protein